MTNREAERITRHIRPHAAALMQAGLSQEELNLVLNYLATTPGDKPDDPATWAVLVKIGNNPAAKQAFDNLVRAGKRQAELARRKQKQQRRK
jgi:hypothetical protein